MNIRTWAAQAVLIACFLAPPAVALSQSPPTASEELKKAALQRQEMRAQALLAGMPFTNIGPTQMGGRIVDVEVDPRQEGTWYVAYASGGLFRTRTHGQSWEPVFEGQWALGMGDLALCAAQPDVIWVGTGESNSSRSSYAGAGVFRTTDAGKTWVPSGLAGTQHIGRVLAHPSDPLTAWVAAIGPLYSPSQERGVFRTSDGGKTWKKTLYVNDTTGVIDLLMDPQNPSRLWASSWTRTRRAWEFNEGGAGTAVWRSEDGGITWVKSSEGLPLGKDAGRIGLAVAPSDPKVLYAVMDNQAQTGPPKEDTIAGLTVRAFRSMDKQAFLLLEDAKLDSFLRGAGYPDRYTASSVKADVRQDLYAASALGNYFGDANEALFRTSIKGCEVYKSTDGGATWAATHSLPLEGVFFTYGYYFGQVRVSPDNANELYTVGVPLLRSADGGKTWAQLDTTDVHGDHHGLWIHPRNSNMILLGSDGGLYLSYDKGGNWTHLNNLPVGQYYTVQVDLQKPFNVYGGLQDNGVYKGQWNADWKHNTSWHHIMGGDGMFAVPDTVDSKYTYTGFQFGNYFRLEEGNPRPIGITPEHDLGKPAYRFNWRTPLVVSPHNHEVIYLGSQYVLRSLNQGKTWEAISPDLTTDKKPQGNVPYSTLTCISESPLQFGMIWTGSDDGVVSLTTDGGAHWQRLTLPVPKGLWVSSLQASRYDKGTAFVTLNGYRNDHFKPYVLKTTDSGKTWTSLVANLPAECVNVLLQDPVNASLLYVGTDHGLYLSQDGGKGWQAVTQVPNVAVYDLVVHPRDHKLVVATHGRSLYLSEVSLLQEMKAGADQVMLGKPSPASIRHDEEWGKAEFPYMPKKEPRVVLHWWNPAGAQGTFTVKDGEGKVQGTFAAPAGKGYQTMEYHLEKTDGGYLPKGTYTVELEINGVKQATAKGEFVIE